MCWGCTAQLFPRGQSSNHGRSCAAEAITLWDSRDFEPLLKLSAEGSLFGSVAVSADNNLIGARNGVNQLHLWSSPSLRDIAGTRGAKNLRDRRVNTLTSHSKPSCESSLSTVVLFFFGWGCGTGKETGVSSRSSFARIVVARSMTLSGRS